MIDHYRREVVEDLVNKFRRGFGITVQWGYAALTRTEPAPSNDVILEEFPRVLVQTGRAIR